MRSVIVFFIVFFSKIKEVECGGNLCYADNMKKKEIKKVDVNIRDFPEELHRELKVQAAMRGVTLKSLILEILEKEMKRAK
jgi:predicted DNA binding CopG/RHH family protein